MPKTKDYMKVGIDPRYGYPVVDIDVDKASYGDDGQLHGVPLRVLCVRYFRGGKGCYANVHLVGGKFLRMEQNPGTTARTMLRPTFPRDEMQQGRVLPIAIPSAREQELESALRMALAWMEEANARCEFDMFTPDHRKLDDVRDERGRVQVGGNAYLNPVFKRIRALVGDK